MATKAALLTSLASLSAQAAPFITRQDASIPFSLFDHPLYVENAPQSPQPYITTAYSSLQAVGIGNFVFRFPATRNSTGNAFSVVLSSGAGSTAPNLTTSTPHYHAVHYETFYPLKGRMQLWGEDQSRELDVGDFGAIPQNATHNFQLFDPDMLMIGIQAPGGFEDFFSLIGTPLNGDSLDTPYNFSIPDGPAMAPPPQARPLFEEIGDFYAQDDYVYPAPLVDGSSPPSQWKSAPNELGGDTTSPYFAARDLGPHFLNKQHGAYQVIQPKVTPDQSGETAFTMSTISISLPLGTMQGNNANHAPGPLLGMGPPTKRTADCYSVDAASMFIVEEGRFVVTVADQPPALLTTSDALFVPPKTQFSYSSAAPFTKVLYASGGSPGGLDTQLMAEGESWSSPMFPLS